MIASDAALIYDVFKFRRFRLNVLSFLRLPLDINEDDLRRALQDNSASLLADYLRRAELAQEMLRPKAGEAETGELDGSESEMGEAEDDGELELSESEMGEDEDGGLELSASERGEDEDGGLEVSGRELGGNGRRELRMGEPTAGDPDNELEIGGGEVREAEKAMLAERAAPREASQSGLFRQGLGARPAQRNGFASSRDPHADDDVARATDADGAPTRATEADAIARARAAIAELVRNQSALVKTQSAASTPAGSAASTPVDIPAPSPVGNSASAGDVSPTVAPADQAPTPPDEVTDTRAPRGGLAQVFGLNQDADSPSFTYLVSRR